MVMGGGEAEKSVIQINLALYKKSTLKPKPNLIIFNHSVHISKKAQPITITKIQWLMLF
jgi:hypothetical protein